ncbi:hypothetical protein NPIL_463661 [Nephila pilipes]|uniref:Uncharacterized protein n=1 Tax=Nephila pilipes TaxID=299642 RepID=A0A8X6UPV7_NEPPI|nr:hypothetical protein NPIL_463661 [Nephila pilipes]
MSCPMTGRPGSGDVQWGYGNPGSMREKATPPLSLSRRTIGNDAAQRVKIFGHAIRKQNGGHRRFGSGRKKKERRAGGEKEEV